MFKIFVTTLLCFSMQTLAAHTPVIGGAVGNGGDIITCKIGNGIATEVLDLWEARRLSNYKISLGPKIMPVMTKVRWALNRLSRLSPERAERYYQQALRFKKEAFIRKGELKDIKDTGGILVPDNCFVEQVVHQLPMPNKHRYLVNKNLWRKLDNDNRAALILHEVIYSEAISYGQKTSLPTRRFNAKLISDFFSRISLMLFVNSLRTEFHFKTIKINNLLFSVTKTTPNFYSKNRIKNGILAKNQNISMLDSHRVFITGKVKFFNSGNLLKVNVVTPAEEIWFRGNSYDPSGAVFFYENGNVRTMQISRAEIINQPNLQWQGRSYVNFFGNGTLSSISGFGHYLSLRKWYEFFDIVSFFRSGRVHSSFSPGIKTVVKNTELWIKGLIVFFEDGQLFSGTLINKTLLSFQNKKKFFEEQIYLNHHGEVVGGQFVEPTKLMINGNELSIKSFHMAGHIFSAVNLTNTGLIKVGSQIVSFEGKILYTTTGILKSGRLSKPQFFNIGGKTVSLMKSPYGANKFYSDGKVKSGTLTEGVFLRNLKNESQYYPAGKNLVFSRSGKVISP